jgi:excinuclease ABC subunit C
MHEVVDRRLRRLAAEDKPLPDLLVIDGGKGQVDATVSVLEELHLDIQVIGLAKRLEEVVFPGERESVLLRRQSGALKLLQWARDEAHRFAIQFQRKQRVRHMRPTVSVSAR